MIGEVVGRMPRDHRRFFKDSIAAKRTGNSWTYLALKDCRPSVETAEPDEDG
jgi:hypothetical protein